MNKKRTFILAIIACLFTGIYAQNIEKDVKLKEIDVNAVRTKMYSNFGRIVKTIDKIEIERSAVKSIDDLLNFVSGIDIRQRGAEGVQADISIRGGNFDQVLILLNGVNITDPQTGHYNLDLPIDISDVSRIEVLQGSAARVLGPNAFSGAINIITNENERNKVSSQIAAGSFGYLSENVYSNYRKNNFAISGSISNKKSDGYINNTDYNITNAYIQSQLNTSSVGNFNIQFAFQQKSYGANSFYSFNFPNQYDHTKTFFSALNWNLTKGNWLFDSQLYARRHHDRFELFRNNEGAEAFSWYKGHNYHQTDVTGGKFTIANVWKYGKTTLGIDLRNEHIYSTVLGADMENTKPVSFEDGINFTKSSNRFLSTAYLDHSMSLNKWFASAGIAVTHNEKFGTYTNGGFDLAYLFSDVSRVFIAANSAARLPTFTDLWYKGPNQVSNPDLTPEQSLTFELGTKINPQNWTLETTAYYRKGYNLIDWIKEDPKEDKWYSKNLTNINAIGVDVNCEYRFNNRYIQSAGIIYSFVNLDKKAERGESKYVLDNLRNKVIINANHHIWSNLYASWNLGIFDRNGKYTDYKTKEFVHYTPYYMLNAKMAWKSDKITLFAEVNNILNQKYAAFGGLTQPGINFNTGIKLSIF